MGLRYGKVYGAPMSQHNYSDDPTRFMSKREYDRKFGNKRKQKSNKHPFVQVIERANLGYTESQFDAGYCYANG